MESINYSTYKRVFGRNFTSVIHNGKYYYPIDEVHPLFYSESSHKSSWVTKLNNSGIDIMNISNGKYISSSSFATLLKQQKIIAANTEINKIDSSVKGNLGSRKFLSLSDKQKQRIYGDCWNFLENQIGDNELSYEIFGYFLNTKPELVIQAILHQPGLLKNITEINYLKNIKPELNPLLMKIKNILNINHNTSKSIKYFLSPLEEKFGFELFPLNELPLDKSNVMKVGISGASFINLHPIFEKYLSLIQVEQLSSLHTLIMVILGDSCTWSKNSHRLSIVTCFKSPMVNDILNQLRSKEHTIPVLDCNGKDSYETIKENCTGLFSKLYSLNKLEVNQKNFSVIPVFVGDLLGLDINF